MRASGQKRLKQELRPAQAKAKAKAKLMRYHVKTANKSSGVIVSLFDRDEKKQLCQLITSQKEDAKEICTALANRLNSGDVSVADAVAEVKKHKGL